MGYLAGHAAGAAAACRGPREGAHTRADAALSAAFLPLSDRSLSRCVELTSRSLQFMYVGLADLPSRRNLYNHSPT